jgi:hypothetical protein
MIPKNMTAAERSRPSAAIPIRIRLRRLTPTTAFTLLSKLEDENAHQCDSEVFELLQFDAGK